MLAFKTCHERYGDRQDIGTTVQDGRSFIQIIVRPEQFLNGGHLGVVVVTSSI